MKYNRFSLYSHLIHAKYFSKILSVTLAVLLTSLTLHSAQRIGFLRHSTLGKQRMKEAKAVMCGTVRDGENTIKDMIHWITRTGIRCHSVT